MNSNTAFAISFSSIMIMLGSVAAVGILSGDCDHKKEPALIDYKEKYLEAKKVAAELELQACMDKYNHENKVKNYVNSDKAFTYCVEQANRMEAKRLKDKIDKIMEE